MRIMGLLTAEAGAGSVASARRKVGRLWWAAAVAAALGASGCEPKAAPPTHTHSYLHSITLDQEAAKAGGQHPSPPPATSVKQPSVDKVAAQIKTEWEPELAARAIRAPEDVPTLARDAFFYEMMADHLREVGTSGVDGAPLALSPSARAARARFKAEIAAKQAKAFPVLRKAYVTMIGQRLWVTDIAVSGHGRGINFVGAIFAANANIQAAEAAALSDLQRYRFSTAAYHWCRGCSGSIYTLETPSDRAVGRWENGSFTEVK